MCFDAWRVNTYPRHESNLHVRRRDRCQAVETVFFSHSHQIDTTSDAKIQIRIRAKKNIALLCVCDVTVYNYMYFRRR